MSVIVRDLHPCPHRAPQPVHQASRFPRRIKKDLPKHFIRSADQDATSFVFAIFNE